MTSSDAELVPGRSCQGCTMCCKLMEVDAIEKPRAVWCPHCNVKAGCKIYETRPEACRIFHCGYLRIADLDDRWKPAKAKFLINYESGTERIVLHVDPDRPDAWRVEPYYSSVKQWARNAAANGSYVLVWTGRHATLVLPDREKALGIVGEDQMIVTKPSGSGLDWFVEDAPR
jgi:hypothetical protein